MDEFSARRAIFVVAMLLFALLLGPVCGAEPKLTAKAGRGTSGVKQTVEEGCVILEITCPSGIGQITVQNGGEPWPMAAKVRLIYSQERAFTHLEGVTLTDSQSRLHTFLGSKSVEVDYLDGGERRDAKTPDLRVEKGSRTVEVLLPMSWLANEKEFTVHWVDFYRG